ncbi:MAG: chitobiase/beta-hexosaminidase C-terminal domain-containing protein [Lachnospiraceae bacterium]|nr:chitobiase/beta-hexosaminidase C-terminal domain-containing protein [Lachnospiraceae bacterium]
MAATTNQNNSKQRQRKKNGNRKVQFLLLAVILLITVVGIVLAVYLLSGYNSRNTFEYQYNASVQAYEKAEYDKAVTYIERALELLEDEDDKEKELLARQLNYSILVAMKDYNGAIKVLLKLLEIEETAQYYTSLLELYSRTGNYAQIEELVGRLENTEYYDVYKNYMIGNVTASIPSGEFTSALTVELIASKSDLVIHYTTDGSIPTVESNIYSQPIKLDTDGKHVIRAIGINAQGVFSEEIIATYIINQKRPTRPEVTPATGEYFEEIMIEVVGVDEKSKVYYTLDGTKPTSESEVYSEPILIKAGNYVFAAVVENENGVLSDVTWRVYDCSPNYSYAYDTALWKLKNTLISKNIMLDMDGNTEKGTLIKINLEDISTIDETGKVYYIFTIVSEYNGLTERYDGYYCISVDDGTLLEVDSISI